jgi:CRP-like cAMP-binding protein
MPKGKMVFEMGSRGDMFYIILSGEVAVYIDIPQNEEENSLGGFYTTNKLKGQAFEKSLDKLKGKYEFMRMRNGDAFGELALINDTPRGASIICTQN